MTSYAAVAIGAVLAPAVLGCGIACSLGAAPAHGRRRLFGHGYVVGQLVVAHATAAWLLLGKPVPGFLLPALAMAIGAWLLWRRRPAGTAAAAVPATTGGEWSWLPCAALALWLADGFTTANFQPIRFGDEAMIWTAKAKAVYAAPEFDLSTALAFFVDHADYPLLDPLAQVLAFATSGRMLQWENRLPIQFFGVALLLLLSGAMARRVPPLLATCALAAFAGTTFSANAASAMADVALACCTLAAADALLDWLETRSSGSMALGCLALAAMLQTKNEGSLLALCLVGAVTALAWRERRRYGVGVALRPLAWIAVPAAAWAMHRGFNAWFSLRNDLTDPAVANGRGLFTRMVEQAPANGGPVVRFYGQMLLDPSMHRLLPLGCLVLVPLAIARSRAADARRLMAVTWTTTTLATAGYMAIFVGTTAVLVDWHLHTAADRLMLHVLPLATLGVAVAATPTRAGAPR